MVRPARGVAISPDGLSAIVSNNNTSGDFRLLERTKLGTKFSYNSSKIFTCYVVSGSAQRARTVAFAPNGLSVYLGCHNSSAVTEATMRVVNRRDISTSWASSTLGDVTDSGFSFTVNQPSRASNASHISISPDNHSLAIIRGGFASSTYAGLTYVYWKK